MSDTPGPITDTTIPLSISSPTEQELAQKLKNLRHSHPSTGVAKLLLLLREIQPEWSVSEKRLKRVLQQEGLMISQSASASASAGDNGSTARNAETISITGEVNGATSTSMSRGKKSSKGGTKKQRQRRRYPISRIDSKVDAKRWTEKLEIRHFDAVKGKGLVATSYIEEGEVVWKEDPWVMTADWTVYSGTVTGTVCAHCSCPLSLRPTSTIFTCPNCPPSPSPSLSSSSSSPSTITNQFCNRLCYSRAQASYHPFLCEGQNPACKGLIGVLRASGWAAPHALGRATGRMLAEWRNWNVNGTGRGTGAAVGGRGGGGSKGGVSKAVGGSEGVWEESWAFFEALAGWTLEDKYRSEGKEVSAAERELWKKVFECYVEAFYQPPTAEGRNKLQQVMRRKTLPPEIISKLFTYDAFMLNVGRVDVNRESHGGLYQLHSHMNHSCSPNISVLHIDVPGSHHAQVSTTHLPEYTGPPIPSRLTLLAKRSIEPNEELTVSYVSPLLGVTERRRELRQWGIEDCQCARCLEEEKELKSEGVPGLDEGRKGELDDLEAELRHSFGFGL